MSFIRDKDFVDTVPAIVLRSEPINASGRVSKLSKPQTNPLVTSSRRVGPLLP